MRNFQDTFETNKRSFISAFSFCMTVPLMYKDVGPIILRKFIKLPGGSMEQDQ